MEEDTPPSYRISKTTEMLMLGVAWSVYATNFIVEIIGDWFGIGEVISLVLMIGANVVFILWFKYKGVSVFAPKVIWKFLLSFILSSLPVINLFYFSRGGSGIIKPGFVARIKSIIETSREEDGASIKVKGWDGTGPKPRHERSEPNKNPRIINTRRDARQATLSDTTSQEEDEMRDVA